LRQMPATTTSIKVTLQSLNISSAVISCEKNWYELVRNRSYMILYMYIYIYTHNTYIYTVYMYMIIYVHMHQLLQEKTWHYPKPSGPMRPLTIRIVFSVMFVSQPWQSRRADGCLHRIEVWLHQRQRHSTGPWEYASRSQDGSTPG
jgi:hypothetical protein